MYRTVNNVANLLIAKDIDRAAATGAQVDSSVLADGEVVITDKYGKILDVNAALGVKEFYVVQGQGASKPLIKSDLINVDAVKAARGQAYSAAQEQIDEIGPFASATAEGLYEIRILEQGLTTVFGNHLIEMIVGYTAKALDTADKVVSRLVKDLSKEVSKRANPNFKVERIHVTGGGLTPLANPATVVKGSELVVCTAHGLAKGDVVEIAGVVYVVDSVLSTSRFTIDQPYQEVSATAAVNKLATATSATYKIILTGLAKKFAVGKFRYEKNRWAATVQGSGMASEGVAVTNVQLAEEGSGTYEQVAEFEWFAQGFEGILERIQVPPVTFRANVEAAGTYSIATIEFTDKLVSTSITGAIPASHKQLYIALKNDGTAGAGNFTNNQALAGGANPLDSGVAAVLDVLLGSTLSTSI